MAISKTSIVVYRYFVSSIPVQPEKRSHEGTNRLGLSLSAPSISTNARQGTPTNTASEQASQNLLLLASHTIMNSRTPPCRSNAFTALR